MAEEQKVGCARPTGGPVGESVEPKQEENKQEHKEERSMIMVGKKAPDFTAPAFHNGQFTSMQLSSFLGKWVVLCCYPGDFTFV
jgi:peroxiredoxin (alkyl hydroperoxide reductase subunit C)